MTFSAVAAKVHDGCYPTIGDKMLFQCLPCAQAQTTRKQDEHVPGLLAGLLRLGALLQALGHDRQEMLQKDRSEREGDGRRVPESSLFPDLRDFTSSGTRLRMPWVWRNRIKPHSVLSMEN